MLCLVTLNSHYLQFPTHAGGALVAGTLSLLAGLLVLFLPETRATKLPQTTAEAEAMQR